MDQHFAATPSSTAADVMTATVVSVTPETSVQDVARLLLEARVSAVPVVDGTGAPIGIVSEGDLLGRSEEDRLSGQEWWLTILAGPGHLEAATIEAATGGTRGHTARDVMHAPVVTAEADMAVGAVAELLRALDMADGRQQVAGVVRWLGRHGVGAHAIVAPSGGDDALRLASLADDDGADLIVAGAYGHSRVREWALGGVTRDLLLHGKRCAFLSH